MDVTTHLLKRTGRPTLKVHGRVLAVGTSPTNHPRYFEITLIESHADGYFVQVGLVATKPGQSSFYRTAHAPSISDLHRVLAEHNPVGYLKGILPAWKDDAKGEHIRESMRLAYLTAVDDLYRQLPPEPFGVTPGTPWGEEPPGWYIRCGSVVLTLHGSWSDVAIASGDRSDLVAFRTRAEAVAACRVLALVVPARCGPIEPYRYE